jgi:serine/threonine protein kinase
MLSSESDALPPKPARDSSVGVQSDVWSVGIVLYVLLSGAHPFDPDGRQTRDQMIASIRSGQFSMAGPRWDEISSEAKDLISDLLQVSPEERPTAAQALSHEWFKSQRTSRQSLAVSLSDTEGLEQYRHLMRRKFRVREVDLDHCSCFIPPTNSTFLWYPLVGRQVLLPQLQRTLCVAAYRRVVSLLAPPLVMKLGLQQKVSQSR